ncbi:hypothetical protein IMZ31_20940 (plasmid) [Pontibacillus sp. ALD_SL1]|uniref:hypothetical protein n=1 Tax=Pontibacillus sp. ALD_SL1 TaxID=2777185 RepID=UPI001A966B2E|nr:hypothetical protein [Pontibacillus sp. ALD_SL1]QST03016.1 hypothetical protein IMZ31_20940 [Pontibacillus sp. ALD_SL1]
MSDILIGILLAIVGGAGFIAYKWWKGRDHDSTSPNQLIPTTQDHLAIDYIRSGVVKLKNGGYRLIVELPSLNIDLMEPEEKEGILERYRQVLNAIEFPFQYLQQSRVVDVSEYLDTLDTHKSNAKNPLLEKQLEYYSEFLVDLIRERSVLTKKFYLVIPYDEEKEMANRTYAKEKNKKGKKETAQSNSVYDEEKRFERAKKQLFLRGTMIERAFRRFQINPVILNDQEVLELFYTSYNKDRSVIQSFKNKKLEDYTTIRVKSGQRAKGGVNNEI